jgi:hypothetical protein
MLSLTSISSSVTALRARARKRAESRFEQRPSLQAIVLLMAWWVALSMGWIGTPSWIWIGGGVLITLGHVSSWFFRNSRSPIRAVIVAIAIVGSLALVPRTITLALNGDWLPVAHFLLLFQGITSFEMRTRGGLYASIGLSGAIFFFVSQQALDLTFGMFLTGYTTLLLSFFALSYLIDQVHNSDVNWFKSKYAFSLFWTGVFVASMLISAGIFMMMPKNLRDPMESAQAVVLPMRASGNTRLPEISTNLSDIQSALPLTAEQEQEEVSRQEILNELAESENSMSQSNPGSDGPMTAPTEPGGSDGLVAGNDPLPDDSPALEGREDIPRISDETLLMQVRSPVMTYWREQVFDEFDGAKWHPDPTYLTLLSESPTRVVYAASQTNRLRKRPMYNQTFFMNQPVSPDSIFTGYSPLVATIPVTDGKKGIYEGTVYRVISAIPEFNREGLSRAEPTSALEFRYHELPESANVLEGLARQITVDARSDLERVRRIVAFLDREYEFDITESDQLALSARPVEFLTEKTSGTTMDFATSTVLLARAAGVPARLVTGYLPGEFDPLSGTYLVREKDRHTWAEVFFGGVGWVPFDSTPLPSTDQFGEGGTIEPGSINSIFGTAYGDDIYEAVKSSPQEFMELVKQGFDNSSSSLFTLIPVITAIALGAFIYWRVMPLPGARKFRPDYARLDGSGRREMLRIYSRAEKMITKAGVVPRASAETIGEYSDRAKSTIGNDIPDFEWIRNAAWQAAYSSANYDEGLMTEAKSRLNSLRDTLRRLKSSGTHLPPMPG